MVLDNICVFFFHNTFKQFPASFPEEEIILKAGKSEISTPFYLSMATNPLNPSIPLIFYKCLRETVKVLIPGGCNIENNYTGPFNLIIQCLGTVSYKCKFKRLQCSRYSAINY